MVFTASSGLGCFGLAYGSRCAIRSTLGVQAGEGSGKARNYGSGYLLDLPTSQGALHYTKTQAHASIERLGLS